MDRFIEECLIEGCLIEEFSQSTPWNFVQGGQIPEMIQVRDYDILIVLGELNTLI